MLMGIGIAFFAIGLAIGVVFSVWQHENAAPQPFHANLAR